MQGLSSFLILLVNSNQAWNCHPIFFHVRKDTPHDCMAACNLHYVSFKGGSLLFLVALISISTALGNEVFHEDIHNSKEEMKLI